MAVKVLKFMHLILSTVTLITAKAAGYRALDDRAVNISVQNPEAVPYLASDSPL